MNEKYKRCSDECSIAFNPEVFAKKVMEENYVAVIVSFTFVICYFFIHGTITSFFFNLQAKSFAEGLVEKYSAKSTECKLTLGNDKLTTYYAFFGVPKESSYQEEMRKE